MKKVILALAVVASVALVSCSSKEAEKVDSNVADTEVVAADSNEVATDSAAADSAVEEAPKADSAEAK